MLPNPFLRHIRSRFKFLVTLPLLLYVFENVECKPEICKNIECAVPHEKFTCSKTTVPQPKVTMKLGAFRDCCVLQQCKDSRDSYFLYVGVINKAAGAALNPGPGLPFNALVTKTNKNTTSCPIYVPFSMVCMIEYKKSLVFQKLLQGQEGACPTQHCTERTNNDKITRTFRVLKGEIPSERNAVKREKGMAIGLNKCPKISCADKPYILNKQTCKMVTIEDMLDRAEIEALGEFVECCPKLWHCEPSPTIGYGLEYMSYEIVGSSFSYFSVILFDEVTQDSKNQPKICDQITCPSMTGQGAHVCNYDITGADEAMTEFAGGYIDCCPLFKCFDDSGRPKHGLLYLEGSPPQSFDGCAKVKCNDSLKLEGAKCSPLKPNERESGGVGRVVGNWKSCCPVWKCTYPRGKIYFLYDITGPSFHFREIQSAKEKVQSFIIAVAGNKRLAMMISGKDPTVQEEDQTDTISETVVTEEKSGEDSSSEIEEIEYEEEEEDDDDEEESAEGKPKKGKKVTVTKVIKKKSKKSGEDSKSESSSQSQKDQKEKSSSTASSSEGSSEVVEEVVEEDEGGGSKTTRKIIRKKGSSKKEEPSKSKKTMAGRSTGQNSDEEFNYQEEMEIQDSKQSGSNQEKTKTNSKQSVTSGQGDSSTTSENSETLEDGSKSGKKKNMTKKVTNEKSTTTGNDQTTKSGGEQTRKSGSEQTSKSGNDQTTKSGTEKTTEIENEKITKIENDKTKTGNGKTTTPETESEETSKSGKEKIKTEKKKSRNGKTTVIEKQKQVTGEESEEDLESHFQFTESFHIGSECVDTDICPALNVTGHCHTDKNERKSVGKFFPKDEACCTITHCFSRAIKRHTTHYVKYAGKIPVAKDKIQKEKGTQKGASCSKIYCIAESQAKDKESGTCSSFPEGTAIFKRANSFLDCCPPTKCEKGRGYYTMEIYMIGSSFAYYELSHYNFTLSKRGSTADDDDEDDDDEKPAVTLRPTEKPVPMMRSAGDDESVGKKESTTQQTDKNDTEWSSDSLAKEIESQISSSTDDQEQVRDVESTSPDASHEEDDNSFMVGTGTCSSTHTCPTLTVGDACESLAYDEDSAQYFPPNETCCEIHYCMERTGWYRTHYVKTDGHIPEASSDIEHEKGKDNGHTYCSRVSCKKARNLPDSCTFESGNGNASLVQITPFLKCCPRIHCVHEDGSYSHEIKIISNAFAYYEYSVFKVKKLDKKKKKQRGKGMDGSSNTNQFEVSENGLQSAFFPVDACDEDDVCPVLKRMGDYCDRKSKKPETTPYFPSSESCCDITHCFDQTTELHRTHYVRISGKIPKAKVRASSEESDCPEMRCLHKFPTPRGCSFEFGDGNSSSPEILPYLHCCPRVTCKRPDGSMSIETFLKSTHFTYHEISVYNIKTWIHDSRDKEIEKELNLDADETTTASSSEESNKIQVWQRGSSCDSEDFCPKLDLPSSCQIEEPKETTTKYFQEERSCCPTLHCFDENMQMHETHYARFSKWMPITKTEVEKVKGKGLMFNGDTDPCPNIKCGSHSKDSESCVKETDLERIHFHRAKPFLECCPVIRCNRGGGVVSVEFKITSTSFSYYEMSFYNITRWDEVITTATEQVRDAETTTEDLMHFHFEDDEKTTTEKSKTHVPQGRTFESESDPERTSPLVTAVTQPPVPVQVMPATTSRPSSSSESKNSTSGKNDCKPVDTCPTLQLGSQCQSESKRETIMTYVPRRERCCPIMRCVDFDGSHTVHYVKYTGSIPTRKSKIKEERGAATSGCQCPNIKCGKESATQRVKGETCQLIPGESMLKQIKPFSECCDFIECRRKDGSYSLELRINATSFTYYEISFFNIRSADQNQNMGGGGYTYGQTKTTRTGKTQYFSNDWSETDETRWGQFSPNGGNGQQGWNGQQNQRATNSYGSPWGMAPGPPGWNGDNGDVQANQNRLSHQQSSSSSNKSSSKRKSGKDKGGAKLPKQGALGKSSSLKSQPALDTAGNRAASSYYNPNSFGPQSPTDFQTFAQPHLWNFPGSGAGTEGSSSSSDMMQVPWSGTQQESTKPFQIPWSTNPNHWISKNPFMQHMNSPEHEMVKGPDFMAAPTV